MRCSASPDTTTASSPGVAGSSPWMTCGVSRQSASEPAREPRDGLRVAAPPGKPERASQLTVVDVVAERQRRQHEVERAEDVERRAQVGGDVVVLAQRAGDRVVAALPRLGERQVHETLHAESRGRLHVLDPSQGHRVAGGRGRDRRGERRHERDPMPVRDERRERGSRRERRIVEMRRHRQHLELAGSRGLRGVGARPPTCALQTLVRSRTCGWIRDWTNDRSLSQRWSTRPRDYRPTPWTSRPSRRCASAGRRAPSWSATTEAELVRAASDPAALLLAGGSNVVVADAGVDATVVRVLTRGVSVDDRGDHVVLRAAAGRAVGRPRRALRRRRPRRRRVPRRHPRLDRRDADPERRRLRAGGRRHRRRGPRARPRDGRHRGARARRLRLRLPDERVQAHPGPLGGARRRPASRARCRERADPLRRAGPHARRRDRRPRAARGGARGRPRAAPRQGHGARPRRPRHVVGRLVLHEPVRRRRGAPRRRARRSRSPTAR